MSASSGSPIAPSSRCTSTTVASARGSRICRSPKPGLVTWWSSMTVVPAVSSRSASGPSRAGSFDVAGDQHRRRRRHLRGRDDQAVQVEGAQGLGHRVRRRRTTRRRGRRAGQGAAERERAAERVRVGPHVGEQRDVVGPGEQGGRRGDRPVGVHDGCGDPCGDRLRHSAGSGGRGTEARAGPGRARRRPVPGLVPRDAVRVGVARRARAHGAAGHLRVGLAGAGEQLLHPAGLVGHHVRDERQRRREPDAGAGADPRPQHAGGAGQRGGRAGGVRDVVDRPAQHRVVDGRVAQVARDPGVGDRDHRQPRVLDLVLQRGGDDLGDPLGEPTRPCLVDHVALLPRVGVSARTRDVTVTSAIRTAPQRNPRDAASRPRARSCAAGPTAAPARGGPRPAARTGRAPRPRAPRRRRRSGHPEQGPAVQVEVPGLGRGHLEPAAQLGDHRPHHRPLLLQRVDVARAGRPAPALRRTWRAAHRRNGPPGPCRSRPAPCPIRRGPSPASRRSRPRRRP